MEEGVKDMNYEVKNEVETTDSERNTMDDTPPVDM